MKTVFVTGGSGFIGHNLTKVLISKGYRVKVLVRQNSNLKYLRNLDIEFCFGDLNDKNTLYRAIKNCDTVFHTAAVVAMWKGKEKQQYQTNVIGTRNICEVALNSGIKKFIHTSSVATLGWKNNYTLIDESSEYNWGEKLTYNYTKFLAEKEVLLTVAKGLPAVIVNPSIVIGPGDYNFHGGALIKRLKNKTIPFYLDGGINISFVDDVVNGHINAALYGKIGERYILGGNNLTIKDALYKIAEIIGVTPPRYKIPSQIIKPISIIFDIFSKIFKIKPIISSDIATYIGKNFWVSSQKAIKELNYKVTPLEEAIRKTVEWYSQEGII